MAWIDRKKAAVARLHGRITPKSEIRAGNVQFRADRDEDDQLKAETEALKAIKPKKKPVAKPKVKKVVKKKVAPKKEEQPKDDFEYGEHGHDFYESEEE